MTVNAQESRTEHIRRALWLGWFTLAWMGLEAAVSIGLGIAANSLSLIAFGADSLIELASALVTFRRLAWLSPRSPFPRHGFPIADQDRSIEAWQDDESEGETTD
jgi:hypothetical protein